MPGPEFRSDAIDASSPITVEIQPVETTNQLLAEAGIGIRQSWGMTAKSIAKVLRVDAVISTSVQKTRYLSDGESFGVELGLSVLNEVTEGWLAPILPWHLVTTEIPAALHSTEFFFSFRPPF